MTKACTRRGQTAGGVLPRSLSQGTPDMFNLPPPPPGRWIYHILTTIASRVTCYWVTSLQYNDIIISLPGCYCFCYCLHPPHLSLSTFSSVGVSPLGKRGSPTIGPPPRLTGDTSPPSDRVGGSKRLLERPGRLETGEREQLKGYVLEFFPVERKSVGAFIQ